MDAVRKIIEHSTNPLTIDLPEEYNNRKVEVIVLPLEEIQEKKDNSRFFGMLKWNGDTLAEQKGLRNEWD